MTSLCIIGAGITGLSLLLLLQDAGADLSKVTIIDPHFDGGDLARRWGPVLSNTPWSKTVNALRSTCPSAIFQDSRDPTQTTSLIDIAHLIRSLSRPILQKTAQIQGEVAGVSYNDGAWTVSYRSAEKQQTLQAKTIICCQGSEPRTLDLPIPSIPLECALDLNRLRGYVKPGQKVLVFGSMHSGTLVMRNLKDISANTTTFYKGPSPFIWDRDGAYDGIKEEAAKIADEIVAGNYKQTKLIPSSYTAMIVRASMQADWVIYAAGFIPRRHMTMAVDGQERDICSYDGITGKLKDAPAAWGFGIAYPNQAPDGKHWDVSVAAFLTHMKQQLPQILAIF